MRDQLIELSSSDDELLEPRMPLDPSRSMLDPSMFPELRLLPDELEPDELEPDRPPDWRLLPLASREVPLELPLLPSPEL